MGACNFAEYQTVTDAQGAFDLAVELAQEEYGYDGYTGTIAEKDSFVVLHATPVTLDEAYAMSDRLLDENPKDVADTYGPAGAIAVADGAPGEITGWLFFGFASE